MCCKCVSILFEESEGQEDRGGKIETIPFAAFASERQKI